MLDFFKVRHRSSKQGTIEIYPDFIVGRSQDLMVRARGFYAIWDEEKKIWSSDEYTVAVLVDRELDAYKDSLNLETDSKVVVRYMKDFSSNSWSQFRNYMQHISDSYEDLDLNLTFQDTTVKKKDHVSKRLPYSLFGDDYTAYDELIGTLYEEEERRKIEWAIGAIISGDAKTIQKFLVLYGEAGAGKSTILNIIQLLFEGYYTTFDAKMLTSANNNFSTESFRNNPLVAINHDGDLSTIADNTKLNAIVSHEDMQINVKYQPSYTSRINCFLFMATNKPVRITDAKSGTIRRLIDVRTSGNKVPTKRYSVLMSKIHFELGAIAKHCLSVYQKLGKNYYSAYRPLDMMLSTDIFFNFVEDNYFEFKNQEYVSLSQAYEKYKQYCDDSLIEHKLPRHKFRDEFKNYFIDFATVQRLPDGRQIRSIFSGFRIDKFTSSSRIEDSEPAVSLTMDSSSSLFDEVFATQPAQYVNSNELPELKWINVRTKLEDLDTSLLHHVKVPENLIVIDFDLKDGTGEKSLELNLEAASKWPATYTEYSKSGLGVHLHYYYDGDITRLSHIYAPGIEIKTFPGNASLRRRLSLCNLIPIAHILDGLPLKGEKLINHGTVRTEKGLRDLIIRNLNKEIHSGTKPSMDFIMKILDDAYASGLPYDLTSMRPEILSFAMTSSNHAEYCMELVTRMKFQSKEESKVEVIDNKHDPERTIFFDVEVFPNLLVVCWKYPGKDKRPVRMINPLPQDIELLLQQQLIGFNNLRYDNHILYARYLGLSLEEVYDVSQRIIGGSPNAMFREAYGLSYTDVYDFSSLKQSLKKFEIDLGLHHQELGFPWDKPVPEELWLKVAEYCDNDVDATEATFDSRHEDFVARQILAELSGLTVNDSTQKHTAKILFGNDANPQSKFVYEDLAETFPGYCFDKGKSLYKGIDPGEGGYVYSEPGMYSNVALLDVASMHPTSIKIMNYFGPYTQRYVELLDARLAIKNKEFEKAKGMLGGILQKYLIDETKSDKLSDSLAYALKIGLNIVYGMTSAKFDNKFRHPKNKDNVVAKRGALFMIDLQEVVQNSGYIVAHIKTDSIKIPNATSEMIELVKEFGQKYGYSFDHEATYERFCLVNKAVYIARYSKNDKKHPGEWTATGAEFAQPYVFKTLFSGELVDFTDFCEVKTVTSPAAMYLDFNETLPNSSEYDKEWLERNRKVEEDPEKKKKRKRKLQDMPDEELLAIIATGHAYEFVGKAGSFCPIKPGHGGGVLVSLKEGKYSSVTGTKGFRWLESEVVVKLGIQHLIDMRYYDSLVNNAIDHITKYGDFEQFRS